MDNTRRTTDTTTSLSGQSSEDKLHSYRRQMKIDKERWEIDAKKRYSNPDHLTDPPREAGDKGKGDSKKTEVTTKAQDPAQANELGHPRERAREAHEDAIAGSSMPRDGGDTVEQRDDAEERFTNRIVNEVDLVNLRKLMHTYHQYNAKDLCNTILLGCDRVDNPQALSRLTSTYGNKTKQDAIEAAITLESELNAMNRSRAVDNIYSKIRKIFNEELGETVEKVEENKSDEMSNKLKRALNDNLLRVAKREIGLLSNMEGDPDTMNTRNELKDHIDALDNFVNNNEGDYNAIKSTIKNLSDKHNDYTKNDIIHNSVRLPQLLLYIAESTQMEPFRSP